MKICSWTKSFLPVAAIILTSSISFSQTPPSSQTFVNNLMPQPGSLQTSPGSFVLNAQFHAVTTHFNNPRLDGAVHRAVLQMRQKTGLPLSLEPVTHGTDAPLTVDVQDAGETIQSVDENEAYTLSVTPSGAHI